MEKKGQTLGLGIMSAIILLVLGLMLLNFLMPEVTDFRTNMNCADVNNISDATKLLCLIGDIAVPYWIIIIIGAVIGIIAARFLL